MKKAMIKKTTPTILTICSQITLMIFFIFLISCDSPLPDIPAENLTEGSLNNGGFPTVVSRRTYLLAPGNYYFLQPDKVNATFPRDNKLVLNLDDRYAYEYKGRVLVEGSHYDISYKDKDGKKLDSIPKGLKLEVGSSQPGKLNMDFVIALVGKARSHTTNDNFSIHFSFKNLVSYKNETTKHTISKYPHEMTFSVNVKFTDNAQATVPVVTYSDTQFTESNANAGETDDSINLTLTKGKFSKSSGTLTQGNDYTFENNAVPTGLTPVFTLHSDTTATLAFTGNATDHTAADNVSNVTLAFKGSAFKEDVVPEENTDLSFTFKDPYTFDYDSTTFNEAVANNGSITQTIDITLSEDTFVQSSGAFTENTHYTITNVPTGLAATLTAIDSTTARLALSGNAGDHASTDSIANMTLTFLAAAVTNGILPTDGTADQAFTVTFIDPYHLSYSATEVNENNANAGGISEYMDITISDNTYSISSGTFTANTHYTITNVPAGLTAVLTRMSASVARLTFTGTATSHAAANSVSNITLTFLSAAFTGSIAPTDGSEDEVLTISFVDNYILIYSAGAQTGDLGGRVGADSICNTNKPGTAYQANVRALISVDGADEIQDMQTLYTIPANQEVRSTSAIAIGDNWADLMDGSLDTNLVSAGVLLFPTTFWWSGSNTSGALGTNHCSNWTDDTMGSGDSGFGADTANWMYNTSGTCNNMLGDRALLCIAFD